MKAIKYLFFFLVVGTAVAAPAEDYRFLSWNETIMLVGGPATTHDQVQGYKMYCSPNILTPAEVKTFTAQYNVPNIQGAGRIRVALADLPLQEGDNWCALTAFNFNNSGEETEGGLSNWLNVKMTAGRFQNGNAPVAVDGFRLEK